MKYFLVDDGVGRPCEVYRCEGDGFVTTSLARAKKGGAWSSADQDIALIIDLWLKGDFDPEEDEISEAQATTYLDLWRATVWPGRQ